MTEILYCAECNQPVVAGAETCNHCGAEVGPDLERASIWHKLQGRLSKATEGKYEVDRLVGYGGMAGVYLARDIHLNRNVALKLILPAVVVDPKMVRRFRQEAQTMAQLNHRHIVPVYDIQESDELLFIVMQYVPGRTLSEVATDASTELAPDLVATWMIQISEALAHAHDRPTSVIHRDIKPSNILLDETGDAQLADFGIAKVQGDSNLTRTGHLIGTPAYMSPEQCRGGSLTAASDQYSLGTVAYELLTGAPPFLGPTLSVLLAHSADEPADLTVSRPGCPSELASVIQRMLAKKPEDRWAGMEEAGEALREAIGSMVAPRQLKVWAKHSLNIDVDARSPLNVGTSQQLQTRVLDSEGEELVGRRVHWSSTNTSVASITREGLVGGERPGSAVLVGRSGKAVTTVEMEIVTSVDGEHRLDPATDGAGSATDIVEPEVDAADLRTETVVAVDSPAEPIAGTDDSDKTVVISLPVSPAPDGTQVLQGLDWGLPSDLAAPDDQAPSQDLRPEGPLPPQPDKTRVAVSPLPVGLPKKEGVGAPEADSLKATPPYLRWAGVAVGVLATGVLGTALMRGSSDEAQMEGLLASVLPVDTVLAVGEQFVFRVELEANEIDGRRPSWSSSDLSVASVSPMGLVEARGPGIVTISLIGDGLRHEPLSVTVIPQSSAAFRRLEFDSLPATMVAGGTLTVRPWFVDQEDQRVPATDLLWTSTDSAVLAVTGPGNFEARGSGTVLIEASSPDFELNNIISIAVTEPPPSTPRSPSRARRDPPDRRAPVSEGAIAVDESQSVGAGDNTRIADSTRQPAAPSARPEPTALSASDASTILDRFLGALKSGDEDRILALIPEAEREDHERYVSFATQGRLEAMGNIQELQINGTTVTFSLPVSARTSFGGSREGTMRFIAELQVVGGVWELRRLVPASGSTPP